MLEVRIAVEQLRRLADEIENGKGVTIGDFDMASVSMAALSARICALRFTMSRPAKTFAPCSGLIPQLRLMSK